MDVWIWVFGIQGPMLTLLTLLLIGLAWLPGSREEAGSRKKGVCWAQCLEGHQTQELCRLRDAEVIDSYTAAHSTAEKTVPPFFSKQANAPSQSLFRFKSEAPCSLGGQNDAAKNTGLW